MKARWMIHPSNASASKMAEELKIHPAIASVLLRRGYSSSSEIFGFLNPSVDSLQSPFAFQDMAKAVERIRLSVSKKERILIYGDYDVDGITGSAILYPILKKIGADVEVHIPHRQKDGYGLNQNSLEALFKKKFSLVITVDNGITGAGPIEWINRQGAQVIVVDHHLPKDRIPAAYAIVSGALPESQGDANLAACGLAFKLGWALMGSFDAVKDQLDLVTLGTVADLAPVLGDNRILLKLGLPFLAKTNRLGLRALMDVAKISRNSITYRDIAFGLGPRINASGRMGSPLSAFKLLVTDNATEAQNLAQILEQGNQDRQRVESLAFEDAVEQVELDPVKDDQKIIVLGSADWHEGVLGIVATRLVDRYQKPAIVMALKSDHAKGSGRSVPNFSIFDAVCQCEDLLINFGGHAQALGLSIAKEKITAFRDRLNEAARSQGVETAQNLEIESELMTHDLDFKFLKDLEKLAPFGPGNQKPLFVSRGMKIRGQFRKRGKDTLQGWVTDQEGKTTCELVGFRSYNRWMAEKKEAPVDIVYQPVLKDFNGIRSIQLELEDWNQ